MKSAFAILCQERFRVVVFSSGDGNDILKHRNGIPRSTAPELNSAVSRSKGSLLISIECVT